MVAGYRAAACRSINAPTPDSLRLMLDHVFAPLDKSQIPNQYLKEYALSEVRIHPAVPERAFLFYKFLGILHDSVHAR